MDGLADSGALPTSTSPPSSARKPSVASSSLFGLSSSAGRSADCRTRSNNYQLALRKQSTQQSTTLGRPPSSLEEIAASIFEHRRPSPAAGVDSNSGHYTHVHYPTSFDEIELWLDGHIQDALAAATAASSSRSSLDMSSSIHMLFLDEKKCARVFGQDHAASHLLPKLKINHWCTSHYQTTFCRYPLPLDADCDDEQVQPVWNWRYSFGHPFDWDLVWAYFPPTRATVAIVRTWLDGYDDSFAQLEHEIKFFNGPTLANPALFGLLALQVLTSDAMGDVCEKGNIVYEAQTLTGFHQYTRLRATDSDGHTICFDLGGVSRKVIGAASRITGWENATVEMAKFARFLGAESERYTTTTPFVGAGMTYPERAAKRLCVYIREQADKLIGDIDGAHHDSRAWLATANFLLMGVLNVLGHDDSQINIELAKDQKRIAEETKRDSTSMTAIAIVTMFFLPGTFTASFFALPFFESDVEAYGFEHFWIYWAVTVPLTIVTLTVWTLYTKFVNPAIPRHDSNRSGMDIDDLDRKRRNVSIVEWLSKTRSKSENNLPA